MPQPITSRARQAITLLDGGTATELQRRGIAVVAPWWTTIALRSQAGRAVMNQVHADYIAAGAEVITANTFRTSRYSLAATGITDAEAEALAAAALDEARAARAQACTASGTVTETVTIAASVPPLGDCYQPEQVAPDEILRAEHRWHIERLADHGAELILAETMNTIREALIVIDEGKRAGLPTWVSFACDHRGRLLSGEDAGTAARAASAAGADAALVNCTLLPGCAAALADMRTAGVEVRIGCYPNVEDRSGIPSGQHVNRYVRPALSPAALAAAMTGLALESGLAMAGGCCGTSPQHIAAIRRAFNSGLSPIAPIAPLARRPQLANAATESGRNLGSRLQ
jgi:S-methylmethionine-dependent homocysteine/selenocysteine methylase